MPRQPNPFDEFLAISKRFQGLAEALLKQSTTRQMGFDALPSSAWAPPMDVLDLPDSFVVLAELPGVRREDIALQLNANDLIISGRRSGKSADQRFLQMERPHGRFRRVIHLNADVEGEQTTARLVDGILEIRIPKAETASGQHIPVT